MFRNFKNEKLTIRVVASWMRRAISESYVESIKNNVVTEDLPFDHLFLGKRRIVLDPSKYGGLGMDKPDTAEDLESFLQTTQVLDKGDKVDWKAGYIVDDKGKVKTRINKGINKGIREFAGKEKEFITLRDKLRKELAKDSSALHQTVSAGKESLYGLVGMGHLFDKDFPTNEITEELDRHDGIPSPASWKKIKGVADAFLKLSPSERSEKGSEHSREYENADVNNLQQYRKTRKGFWDAHALFLMYGDSSYYETDQTPRFKDWVNRTEDYYNSKGESDVSKLHELASKISPQRYAQLEKIDEVIKDQQKYDHWRGLSSNDLSIVVSRDPIDIIRMSDHPKAVQSIESCHSEGGSEFECAINESEEGGLIAYVVKTSDLEGKNLDKGELFEDQDREVKGIKPFSRLRLRRFESGGRGTPEIEVAVPELKTYGAKFPNFVQAITNWAREEQPEFFHGDDEYSKNVDDWRLTGGQYQDNSAPELFNNFFDKKDEPFFRGVDVDRYDPYGEGYTIKDSPYYNEEDDEDSEKDKGSSPKRVKPWTQADYRSEFWDWMEESNPEVQNPNSRGRQDRISPTTLKGYARGSASYSHAARQLVMRYLQQYLREKEQKG